MRQAEQVNATAPAKTGVPVSAALRPHSRQVVVVNVGLLDGVGVSGSDRERGALCGGRLGLPPGCARLLPLEPDQQALTGEADDAAAAQDGHRGVLQRPAQDCLLVDPH